MINNYNIKMTPYEYAHTQNWLKRHHKYKKFKRNVRNFIDRHYKVFTALEYIIGVPLFLVGAWFWVSMTIILFD